ncbi:MAG: DUF481 domain-containing protein, partial [Bryobacteraceae bacterium]
MHRVLIALALLCCAVSVAGADTIVFKNGDKLTGTFVRADGAKVTLKSDVAGEVTVAADKIQSLGVAKPVVMMTQDKKTIKGQLEMDASGAWRIAGGGAEQTVRGTDVAIILPEETYQAQVEHVAKWGEYWKGAANFGYSIQRGDQQTGTLSTTVAVKRERPAAPVFMRHWRTNYGLTMLFSKAEQNSATIRSNTISTNLRQDYLFTERGFAFGFAQLDHIDAQDLHLRQTYGGGYG